MRALENIPQFTPTYKRDPAKASQLDAALLSGLGILDIKETLKTSVSRVYERRAILIANGAMPDTKTPQRKRRVRVGDTFKMLTYDKHTTVTVNKVGRKYFTIDELPARGERFEIATHQYAGSSRCSHILVKMID